jgi:hypothetical protein
VEFFNAFGAAGKIQMDQYLYRHFVAAPQNEIQSVTDMLLLDDNDGNLANGTPNVAKFYQGFTVRHGVPFPVQLINIVHQPLHDTLDQFQPYQVHGAVSSITGTVTAVTLYWRLTGTAAFTPVNLSNLGGGAYMGVIPVQPPAQTIEYYIRAADSSGIVAFSPAGAPAAVNSFSTTLT